MKLTFLASATALSLSFTSANATNFAPPSIFEPPTTVLIPDPPPILPPEAAGGDIWVRPLPDVSGQNQPGLVGGYNGNDGLGGTIFIAPGGDGGGISINGIPIPGS